MRTPLGPTPSVQIRGVSLFQGLFNVHKIHLGPHAVSTLQWVSLHVFQGCPQGRVPLYIYIPYFRTMAEKEDKKLTLYLLYAYLFGHCSKVGQQSCSTFSSLPCFCTFSGPFLLERKFFHKLFPSIYSYTFICHFFFFLFLSFRDLPFTHAEIPSE